MEAVDVFTVRDLRNKTGSLIKGAENGKISLITKHGRPTILAVPFSEQLLAYGVNRAIALHLLENNLVALPKAAKIASMGIEDFMELVNESEISAVDYPAEELEDDLENLV